MTYRKLKIAFAALAGLLLTTQSALAAKFPCRVTPTSYLGVNGVGWVLVGVEGPGWLQVCNLNSTVGGVTPDNCKAWYSAFLTWQSTNKSGWFYFDGSQNGNAIDCTNFVTWDTRIPYYLEGPKS